MNTDDGLVTITVTAVNDLVTMNDVSVTTPEDTKKYFSVGNYYDADRTSIRYTRQTQPGNGILVRLGDLNDDGYVVPQDSLIIINYLNDPGNPAHALSEKQLLAADFNKDGSVTSADVTALQAYIDSTAAGNPQVEFVYNPNENWNGTETVTMRAGDGVNTDDGLVTITVTAVNDKPVITVPAPIDVTEDTPKTFQLPAVDQEDDAVTYKNVVFSGPGTLSCNASGACTYTPAANDDGGPYTFTIVADDGPLDSDAITVTLEITPVNDKPVITVPAPIDVTEDTPKTFQLPAVDQEDDAVTYKNVVFSGPGTLSCNASGACTYTPAANDDGGPYTFTIVADDGPLDSDPITVTLEITPVNDAPAIVAPGEQTVNEDTNLTIAGIQITDVDNPPGTVVLEVTHGVLILRTDVSGGLVTGDISGNGTKKITLTNVDLAKLQATLDASTGLIYRANQDYNGSDALNVNVNDGALVDSKQVNITVTAVNDAPVILEHIATISGTEDQPINFSTPTGTFIPSNTTYQFYDPESNDGELLTLVLTVAHGTLQVRTDRIGSGTISGNGTNQITLRGTENEIEWTLSNNPFTAPYLIYTPDANFNGTDSMNIFISDDHGESASAATVFEISPLNDAPVIVVPGAQTVNEDTNLTIAGIQITDADNPTGTVVLEVTHGVLTLRTDVNGGLGMGAISGNGTKKITLTNVDLAKLQATLDAPDGLVYRGDPNFSGDDELNVSVNDGTLADSKQVNIEVSDVDHEPVIPATTLQVIEDTPKDFTLPLKDGDGETITYTIGTPIRGTVTCTDDIANNVKHCTYTPEPNFFGTDEIPVAATDPSGPPQTAIIPVKINSVEDEPVIPTQAIEVNEDSSVTFDLPLRDDDNEAISYTIGDPDHGTVVCNDINGGTKRCTYTPDPNYNGPDEIQITAEDTSGPEIIATQPIIVNPVQDDPTAQDITVSIGKNTSLEIQLVGLDVDGDRLSYQIAGSVAHGTLMLNIVTGVVIYTPDTDYTGPDSFQYLVTDGKGLSQIATVRIQVIETDNHAPIASDVDADVDEDDDVTIPVDASDDDGDPLTPRITMQPEYGSVEIVNGEFVYTPDPDFNGTDTFTYQVSDGNTLSNIATVTITVNSVEDVPVAKDLSVTAIKNTALNIFLKGSDGDGDSLSFNITGGPSHGTFTVDAVTGLLVYTPANGYLGADSIDYTVTDGKGVSQPATVIIDVVERGNNTAPVAQARTVDTTQNVPVGIALSGSDVDGDTLSFELIGGPSHGTIQGFDPSTGVLTYIPGNNFIGSDTFSFRVFDGKEYSVPVVITLNVIDDIAPVGQVTINGGQELTNNQEVRLVLELFDTATPAADLEIAIAVNSQTNFSSFIKVSQLVSNGWGTLVPGVPPSLDITEFLVNGANKLKLNFNGTNFINFKIRDAAGNQAHSRDRSGRDLEFVFNRIILDNVIPTGTLAINDGEEQTSNPEIVLWLELEDNLIDLGLESLEDMDLSLAINSSQAGKFSAFQNIGDLLAQGMLVIEAGPPPVIQLSKFMVNGKNLLDLSKTGMKNGRNYVNVKIRDKAQNIKSFIYDSILYFPVVPERPLVAINGGEETTDSRDFTVTVRLSENTIQNIRAYQLSFSLNEKEDVDMFSAYKTVGALEQLGILEVLADGKSVKLTFERDNADAMELLMNRKFVNEDNGYPDNLNFFYVRGKNHLGAPLNGELPDLGDGSRVSYDAIQYETPFRPVANINNGAETTNEARRFTVAIQLSETAVNNLEDYELSVALNGKGNSDFSARFSVSRLIQEGVAELAADGKSILLTFDPFNAFSQELIKNRHFIHNEGGIQNDGVNYFFFRAWNPAGDLMPGIEDPSGIDPYNYDWIRYLVD